MTFLVDWGSSDNFSARDVLYFSRDDTVYIKVSRLRKTGEAFREKMIPKSKRLYYRSCT